MDSAVMLIFWITVIFILYMVIKYGVRAGQSSKLASPKGVPSAAPSRNPSLNDLGPPGPARPANIDGPGLYDVHGVDRESKMDTVWRGTAASAANAKVKAELEGVVVTRIERIDHTR